MTERKPIIQIQHVSKIFYQKKTKIEALKDITLDIYPGEIFGIIGLSGAGKSTLVRCINYLERPTEGTILFQTEDELIDLGSLNNKELIPVRQKISMIFQQFNLMMQRNALENVCFPLELAGVKKEVAREKATKLLELVGLADRMEAYPSQLSGGQKQRVAIARALATDPKILLCDEATSALDPNTTNQVLQLLKDINKKLGVTIILITHEMSVIEKICNRVAIIDNSQIAEVASVQKLFSNPKTAIAKHLVFPEQIVENRQFSRKALRIVFNGVASTEPIISNMVLECKSAVNIMFADTRDVDGKAMGQMIVQLPEDELTALKMKHYLSTQDVVIEEVELNA